MADTRALTYCDLCNMEVAKFAFCNTCGKAVCHHCCIVNVGAEGPPGIAECLDCHITKFQVGWDKMLQMAGIPPRNQKAET